MSFIKLPQGAQFRIRCRRKNEASPTYLPLESADPEVNWTHRDGDFGFSNPGLLDVNIRNSTAKPWQIAAAISLL